MTGLGLLWLVIIGAVAGWLAGRFMKGHGLGLLGDIVVGIVGAFIGGFLFHPRGVEIGHGLVSLIAAFVCAVILLAIVRLLFTDRRAGRRLW